MNPIKQFINLHINMMVIPIFGSIVGAVAGKALGGLFGKSRPDYPSMQSQMPNFVRTNGLLSNTQTKYGDGGLTSSMTLTPQGTGLVNEYGALKGGLLQDYQDFSIPSYMQDRYGLMKDMMDRSDLVGANRLLEAQNAATGGVGVSTGSRQLMSDMAQGQEYTRNKTLLDLMGMGEQREGNLLNRYTGALSGYTGLLQGFDNSANRDQQAFAALANVTQQNATGRFTDDMSQYNASQNFWNGIGSGFGSFAGSGGGFFGGGSGGGFTGGFTQQPNLSNYGFSGMPVTANSLFPNSAFTFKGGN